MRKKNKHSYNNVRAPREAPNQCEPTNRSKHGYKETKCGWIPEDWECEKLSNIANIAISNVDKKEKQNHDQIKLCNYMDVVSNEYINKDIKFMISTASKNEIKRFSLYPDDVIITKDSETREEIAIPSVVIDKIDKLVCGYHLVILRPKKSIIGKFLSREFYNFEVHKQCMIKANGVTRFGLRKISIQKLHIPLPPKQEQEKTAEILGRWDKAIEQVEQLIEAKKKLRKGLMQQLLTGIMRFPEFGKPVKEKGAIPEGWREVKLGEIFTERTENNPNNNLLAITKEDGVIRRDEVDRRDTSSSDKSKYKLIENGDIGYNTMRMWQGVCGLSNLNGIVSPAYTICKPKPDIEAKYFAYLFKLRSTINKFYRYSQGLVNDTLNLKFHNFSKIRVIIPVKNEQIEIASLLSFYDKQINDYKSLKESFEKQKKGLMQKLLTGEIRVNQKSNIQKGRK